MRSWSCLISSARPFDHDAPRLVCRRVVAIHLDGDDGGTTQRKAQPRSSAKDDRAVIDHEVDREDVRLGVDGNRQPGHLGETQQHPTALFREHCDAAAVSRLSSSAPGAAGGQGRRTCFPARRFNPAPRAGRGPGLPYDLTLAFPLQPFGFSLSEVAAPDCDRAGRERCRCHRNHAEWLDRNSSRCRAPVGRQQPLRSSTGGRGAALSVARRLIQGVR